MKPRDGSLLRNLGYLGIGLASTIVRTLFRTNPERSQLDPREDRRNQPGARADSASSAKKSSAAKARRILLDRGAVPGADEVLLVAADLRNPDQAQRLIDEATRRFGRVEVLINNA